MITAILLALASSTPAPAEPAAPKTIIEVHSESTLCTTLHATVAPVLVGLMQDDRVIDFGQKALAKMLHDRAAGSQAAGMDRLQLENASRSMIHNLAVIDGLLADTGKFPVTARSDAERTANAIKSDLQSVAARQKEQLNEIYGMMDTDELGSMQTDFPAGNEGFGSISQRPDPNMQKAPAQTPPPVAAAGLAAAPGDAQAASGSSGNATTIAALENRASSEIVRAAAACHT